MIKEILTYKLIHITCPRQFGKSTNMDMVKRFLEINVDENGEPKLIKTTDNYKLFMNNKLKIFQKVYFFHLHFGKYPIMFLDYSDFTNITNFDSVLPIYKTIIQRAFFKHKYLLRNQTLSSNITAKETFNQYCDGKVFLFTENDIRKAFEFLLQILFNHFQKQVYILIDNYDAHVHSLIFQDIPDLDRILTFIHTINEHLLNNNDKLIYGAFVTGVLRLSSALPSIPRTEIQHFKFFFDHSFADFYGVTEYELDDILIKLVRDEKERNQTKHTIDEYYKGYTIATQNTNMYNTWSIVNFLQNRQVKNYWCKPDSFESFKSVFSAENIKTNVETLLSKKKVWASVSNPFFNEEIIDLNHALINKKQNNNSQLVDLIFVLLYHFGFLSVTDDVTVYSIALKIPNREIFDEFKKAMEDVLETIDTLNLWNKFLSNSSRES